MDERTAGQPVRQSLTLLGSLALAVGVPLGLGLLTVRILG